jgi:drug/metabolite transporter (DMT)-like permease
MWGMLAVALKITLHRYQLSPFTIVWFRFSLAFVLLAIILLFHNPNHFSVFKRPPLKLVGASVCLGFNYYGYMRGLDYTVPQTHRFLDRPGPCFLL